MLRLSLDTVLGANTAQGCLCLDQYQNGIRTARRRWKHCQRKTEHNYLQTDRYNSTRPISTSTTSRARLLVCSRRAGNQFQPLYRTPPIYRRPSHHLPRRQRTIHKTRTYRRSQRIPWFRDLQTASQRSNELGTTKPNIFQPFNQEYGDGEDGSIVVGRDTCVEGFDMCPFSGTGCESVGEMGL